MLNEEHQTNSYMCAMSTGTLSQMQQTRLMTTVGHADLHADLHSSPRQCSEPGGVVLYVLCMPLKHYDT